MNILDEIVAQKKIEVQQKRSMVNDEWKQRIEQIAARKCISLCNALSADNSTGIIAEFKRRSPSKGWFKPSDCAAPPVVMQYEQAGAAGCSILTDELFFGGNTEDIIQTRSLTNLPVLRKDFIIDEIQIEEARVIGADVILLIAAILTPAQVETLSVAAKHLGMEVLLEIHNENEIDHVCDSIDLVGVNNRNLATFEVRIDTSLYLINKLPKDKICISESGISSVDTIIQLKQAGFKGFLIGESFMKQEDPGAALTTFANQLNQVQ